MGFPFLGDFGEGGRFTDEHGVLVVRVSIATFCAGKSIKKNSRVAALTVYESERCVGE